MSVLELIDVTKSYGRVDALRGVSLGVDAGQVTCVLGDNGAGKSTLIKIMAGRHEHTSGRLVVDGQEKWLKSPHEAQELGIATVYQDLALVPLMSIWRNFFLGNEIRRGLLLDIAQMKNITDTALRDMGIIIDDLDRPVGRLSGGQRQVVAIARAVHFGARVIILDEPTAALGVRQSKMVLKYITRARAAGLGVVFITHNPHHAFLVGDRFVVLKLGEVTMSADRDDITLDQLTAEMAGGSELDALAHELSPQ